MSHYDLAKVYRDHGATLEVVGLTSDPNWGAKITFFSLPHNFQKSGTGSGRATAYSLKTYRPPLRGAWFTNQYRLVELANLCLLFATVESASSMTRF